MDNNPTNQNIIQTPNISQNELNPKTQAMPNRISETIKKMIANPTSLLLRIGLAFVFLYAAIFVSTVETGSKYVPPFITNIIPIKTFLLTFGIFEILLSLWLLSGKFTRYSGLVSALLLINLTVFNLEYFSVLFRNIAIICAALALAAIKED